MARDRADGKDERAARRTAALRANLQRRKEQARAREAADAGADAAAGDGGEETDARPAEGGATAGTG